MRLPGLEETVREARRHDSGSRRFQDNVDKLRAKAQEPNNTCALVPSAGSRRAASEASIMSGPVKRYRPGEPAREGSETSFANPHLDDLRGAHRCCHVKTLESAGWPTASSTAVMSYYHQLIAHREASHLLIGQVMYRYPSSHGRALRRPMSPGKYATTVWALLLRLLTNMRSKRRPPHFCSFAPSVSSTSA